MDASHPKVDKAPGDVAEQHAEPGSRSPYPLASMVPSHVQPSRAPKAGHHPHGPGVVRLPDIAGSHVPGGLRRGPQGARPPGDAPGTVKTTLVEALLQSRTGPASGDLRRGAERAEHAPPERRGFAELETRDKDGPYQLGPGRLAELIVLGELKRPEALGTAHGRDLGRRRSGPQSSAPLRPALLKLSPFAPPRHALPHRLSSFKLTLPPCSVRGRLLRRR